MNKHHQAPALLLDEMHHPKVAEELRNRGYDVIAVADTVELRGHTDEQLCSWAAEHQRWIVTENIKDFRPLHIAAREANELLPRLLLTSPHAFPRSRKNFGRLIAALVQWLEEGHQKAVGAEDWLTG
ncbi:MAG: hypothetical protein DLM55_12290 [Acidimicrobiales bacterium]|nr:MAG: hypothetical protein DLM55_12290 [Acidimicrobiales bacterium]